MKLAKTYKYFCKIKRKYNKRNTIKRIGHIHGKRFTSYWEYKDWVGYIIDNIDKLDKYTISYIQLMIGNEWYNHIKEDIAFLLNNTGLVISVKWSKNDKTIKGVFGGIVLTNRDAYYLIDDNLVPTFFILEKN